ncbi:MAG: hypothetical protein AB7N91_20090 [Candidatus Tectimicrobiota bacterium]
MTRIWARGARKRYYLLWGVLLACGLVWIGGCIRTLPYQPNERLIDALGMEQARQRLQAVLTRAVNPHVVRAEVTDDMLYYRYRHDLAGVPTGIVLENRLHFLNVVTIEVYANDVVIVRTASHVPLAQFVFGNPQDPKELADLLASFRLRRAQQGG